MLLDTFLVVLLVGVVQVLSRETATRRFDLDKTFRWNSRQNPSSKQSWGLMDRKYQLGNVPSSSEWSNEVREFNKKWSKFTGTFSKDLNKQWSNLDNNWSNSRDKRTRYFFKHHNGIDIKNDHGWGSYPAFDVNKVRKPTPVRMPSPPTRPDFATREWPEWLPPIRMIKLPLDTPPER